MIYVTVLISVLNLIAFTGSKVAISLYALELGAHQTEIGAVSALNALFPTFLSITIGKLADRVKPRSLVITANSGLCCALLLPAVFPGITGLCDSSALLGLFNQISTISIEAGIGAIGGNDKRVRNYSMLTTGYAI